MKWRISGISDEMAKSASNANKRQRQS